MTVIIILKNLIGDNKCNYKRWDTKKLVLSVESDDESLLGKN